MNIPEEGQLMRIFVAEKEKWQGKPLYEQLLVLARKEGMASATAIKGFMGFWGHSGMHTAKLLELSEDLPIIIEIVDSPKNISRFLPQVEAMVQEGLVTLEKANIKICRFKS